VIRPAFRHPLEDIAKRRRIAVVIVNWPDTSTGADSTDAGPVETRASTTLYAATRTVNENPADFRALRQRLRAFMCFSSSDVQTALDLHTIVKTP